MASKDMPALRRDALIRATIAEIGGTGSLDVTVSQIARRAGMSAALAHHYFGSKDRIFLAAIAHVLTGFRQAAVARLRRADGPRARIDAIIDASFDEDQFEQEVVAAWLAFYARALHSPETRRLLHIYARRLHSNLMFNLRALLDAETAETVAQGLAALIDGFYIRHALQGDTPDRAGARRFLTDYLDLWLARKGGR